MPKSNNIISIAAMKTLTCLAAALLSTITHAQNFSNFAHDCEETGYNEDYTVVTGSDCAFNVTNQPFPPESLLSLDNCLSFDGRQLVSDQG